MCHTQQNCGSAYCPQGGNWYVHQSECEQLGGTPTPTYTPTPTPSGGGGGTSTPTPTPTPTVTEPPRTAKPGTAFIFYLDTSGEGDWNYATEQRISPEACVDPSTVVMPGFAITVPNWEYVTPEWHCNVGESEGSGGCNGDPSICNGVNCGRDIGTNSSYYNSCLGSQSCYPGGCRWTGTCFGGDATTMGALCRVNGDYCFSSGYGNLRNGAYFKAHQYVGNYEVQVTLPAGWQLSSTLASKIGSVNDFTCSADGTFCTGLVQFATNGTADGGFSCRETLIKFGVERKALPPATGLTRTCSTSAAQATFSWNIVPGADGYLIRMDHNDQCLNNAVPPALAPWYCPSSTGTCNASYGTGVCADQIVDTRGNPNCYFATGKVFCTLPIIQGHTYDWWSVQAIVPGETSPYISPQTYAAGFMCQQTGTVVGEVYYDPTGIAQAGVNNCTGPTPSPVSGVMLALRGGMIDQTQYTDLSGRVTYVNIPYGPPTNQQYTLRAYESSFPTGYVLTCPQSPMMNVPTIPNTSNPLRFFIASMRSAWYQVAGGNVRGESGSSPSIRSIIPGTCTSPACSPYVLTQKGGVAQSDGYAVTGTGGSISTSENTSTPLANLRQTDTVYAQSDRIAVKEGWDYFYRQYSMGTAPRNDFGSSLSNLQLSSFINNTSLPQDERTAYYANGTVTISTPWSIPAGRRVVIFIDGDLNINSTITVPQGSFLAFIVHQNINIYPGVGSTIVGSTTPVVEGVYIADGEMRVCSYKDAACANVAQDISDNKFVGAGVFVGWSGINLRRSFSDTGNGGLSNNANPVELFQSRPDLLLNTPDEMKKPNYLWQEVSP